MGIESLIVFIALIIVAMFAVTVLLGTTGNLQNAASITGEESTDRVVQRVDVFGVRERDSRIVEGYGIASHNVSLNNRTTTLSNGGSSLSFDWDEPLAAAVNGSGDVTLEADGETMSVQNGHVLRVTAQSPGANAITLENENTSESLPQSDRITVQDDGDSSDETLTLSYGGNSVAAGETEDLAVTATYGSVEFLNAEPVTATVDSSDDGAVELSDGDDSLTVNDGDTLRFYHWNDTVRNVDEGTSASMREFAVVDDGDADGSEGLTLTHGGESVSLTEGSPFRIEALPSAERIREDSGTTRSVAVSSGGNVTLSDGSGTLELNDSEALRVSTPEPGTFELENVDSGATLETDDAIDVVDDGDGTPEEVLRIGPVVAEEGAPSKLHLSGRERSEATDESGLYGLTVGKSPGSDEVDLADATVAVVGPTNATTLTYAESGSPEPRETFVVEAITDEDGTVPVLTDDGDRFLVQFDAGAVPDDEELTVRITTGSGATRVIVVDGDGYRG